MSRGYTDLHVHCIPREGAVRFRTHLYKWNKIKSRASGYLRFPSAELYTHYGLCKFSTAAGWAKAYALR